MKFRCRCGEIISDTTDYLHYKARLIADQDWYDFLESETEGGGHDWRLTSEIYQCTKCGRLIFFKPDNHGVFFKLEEETEGNKKLLCSVKRSQWKRNLLGSWNSREKEFAKGHIVFQDCFGEGYEKFDDWAVLEKRYFEILEQLKQSDTLRIAWLTKDGKMLYQWPEAPAKPK
jgi:hypothetical protein